MMYSKMSERRILNNRIRRRRELRRNFMLMFLTLVLTVTCSTLFFTLKTKAQGNDEVVMCKYYKSVMISDGDTLWGFAEKYADPEHYSSYQGYIDEVLCMNGMVNEQITIGQHLLLPYYSDDFLE